MLKFFRRIRQKLIDEGNLKRYLIYAIGEILLVMIGILLAIRVNNSNNTRINKKAEIQHYQNFKRQITEDQQIIKGAIAYNNNYWDQYQYAINIIEENDRSKIDTLGYITLNLTKYSDFDRPSNIYESMVNSGELKLLKNNEIIERIQRLEETYIYFNRMEEIHYDLIISIVPELITLIKHSNRKVEQEDKLFTYHFQNIFILAANIMKEKDEVYNRALGQIKELIDLIDKELTNN